MIQRVHMKHQNMFSSKPVYKYDQMSFQVKLYQSIISGISNLSVENSNKSSELLALTL